MEAEREEPEAPRTLAQEIEELGYKFPKIAELLSKATQYFRV